MLTESKIIDFIEVTENGNIQVREAIVIKRDDQEISRTFHRYVLHPGDGLLNQPARVVAIAEAVWTTEVIQAYLDSLPKDSIIDEEEEL